MVSVLDLVYVHLGYISYSSVFIWSLIQISSFAHQVKVIHECSRIFWILVSLQMLNFCVHYLMIIFETYTAIYGNDRADLAATGFKAISLMSHSFLLLLMIEEMKRILVTIKTKRKQTRQTFFKKGSSVKVHYCCNGYLWITHRQQFSKVQFRDIYSQNRDL